MLSSKRNTVNDETAKRRAAFTSLADSDPGHLEARASPGRVRPSQHHKLSMDAADSLGVHDPKLAGGALETLNDHSQ
jgi:hypothetical protein